jgi:putative transferase (TIGR04331 family)
VKRFLVTTALEETWRDDVPVLFLGEWCRRYSRRERWEQMDAEVLPYHWDDRTRLRRDYDDLQQLYESLLGEISAQLNKLHKTRHSVRYWRILLGPWLGYFLQIVFDRWTMLQVAIRFGEISETSILNFTEREMVPNDMEDFIEKFLGDEWNHYIYASLIKEFTDIKWETREPVHNGNIPKNDRLVGLRRRLQRGIARGFSKVSELLVGNRDVFFLNTYLPPLKELLLHCRLGQVPQLWRSVSCPTTELDPAKRKWRLAGSVKSDFATAVQYLIPFHLPKIYLEGYGDLVSVTESVSWPKQPRLIWTSSSEIADDTFKAWAAQKTENGTPLVIGQHGGHYGLGLWSFSEDHQIAISDRYFTWGWSDEKSQKIVPVGQFKSKDPLGVCHANQPSALMVTAVHPRYSYVMYSTPVASQWQLYFADQFEFVANLPSRIQSSITVRLYPQDLGWDQEERWRNRFPKLRLDLGGTDINQEIQRCRIYISTYNATTFLESFTMDVPTVIFWNSEHWELRSPAEGYFDELRRVGIFHDSPASAARHIAGIWEDVDAWWGSPSVRAVLERFKQTYCHLPPDLIGRVEGALRKTMVETST